MLVFAGALALRLLYLLTLAGNPWVNQPIVDEVAYREMAFAVLHGSPDLYPLFRPPLWPFVLSLYYAVAGTDAGFFGVRVLSAVIGALAVLSGFRVAERLFDRRIAWFSATVAALCGITLHLHTTGLATSLFTLLTVEAVRRTIVAREPDSPPVSALFAGILWGLAVLARPNALVSALVSAAWLLVAVRTRHRIPLENRILRAFALVLALILVVAPVTMLNWVHGRDFVIVSNNGGINFYLGNNRYTDGMSPQHPQLGPDWSPAAAEQWASEQAGRRFKPSEASGWYYRKGLEYWRDHPFDAAGLWLKKLLLTVGGTETSNNGDWKFFAEHRIMLRALLLVGFWWIGPLAFIGIWLRRKDTRVAYLAAIVALNLLLISMFFVASRFRAPLIPLLAPFAVHTIATVVSRRTSARRTKRVALAAIVLTAGLNLAAYPFRQPGNPAYGHLLTGRLHEREGDTKLAADHYREALSHRSDTPFAHMYLGDLARKRGDWEQAIANYRRENEIKPRWKAYRGLGICYRERGVHDSARVAFEQAYLLNPTDDTVRRALAEEIGEQAIDSSERGDWRAAADRFARARRVAPENPFFTFGLAGARWALGDSARADRLIDSLLRKHPGFIPALRWKEDGWRPAEP
ncbi:MAG: hypothetical protein MAG453_02147 [Calditrichaeota bacterium]|nr:hypothetical protein [Calditrichota bacterium]